MTRGRREAPSEPNEGDGLWGWRSWAWYFAPAPVVLVVAVMIYTDAFIVVGVIALVVLALGAFLWHQLDDWF
jgi:hypothetical protein